MKTNSIIFLVLIALLSFSCGEKSDKAYEESVEAQNEMSGPLHDSDTNIVRRDGTLMPEAIDQSGTDDLPSPVLEAIDMDNALSTDKITDKKVFEENGITYYELSFETEDRESLTIVYDDQGKVKSTD
ncbi:hypothetical protein J2X69_003063 [Algoriphagus sp. 4150]|uniref:hypothetical protein n=1 Tax=Algoriphagus sp. 4150 TaxID=2817756 RepID=UPI00285CF170|nr:hypothetical protein [Algoriphagus sp. 4150]MDR7130706.1 hypothetical protein [Algoriphagus sp. 4150]